MASGRTKQVSTANTIMNKIKSIIGMLLPVVLAKYPLIKSKDGCIQAFLYLSSSLVAELSATHPYAGGCNAVNPSMQRAEASTSDTEIQVACRATYSKGVAMRKRCARGASAAVWTRIPMPV